MAVELSGFCCVPISTNAIFDGSETSVTDSSNACHTALVDRSRDEPSP